MKKWKKVSSEIVHKNPFYCVRRDEVLRPDGQPAVYHVVDKDPFVVIVPIDAENRVLIIELHRYTTDMISLELPMGSCEHGEDPLATAKRELEEETGFLADRWTPLSVIQHANGITSILGHVFLAEELKHVGTNMMAEEGISDASFMKLADAADLIRQGRITDSDTITGITLACLHKRLLLAP